MDWENNCKDTALTGFTLQVDASAHEVDQLLGDREPESNTPIIAGDRILHLTKWFKDIFARLTRDTHTCITDLDRPMLNRWVLDADAYASLTGEFDGITNEVDHNLTQPSFITTQLLWHINIYGHGKSQTFFAGKNFH